MYTWHLKVVVSLSVQECNSPKVKYLNFLFTSNVLLSVLVDSYTCITECIPNNCVAADSDYLGCYSV